MKVLNSILILVFSLSITVLANAEDRGSASKSTAWTQLLENHELLNNNIKQVKKAAKNLEKPNDLKLKDASSVLKQLSKVVEEGRAIAYSSSQIDKNYHVITKNVSEFYGQKYSPDKTADYMTQYDDWSKTNRDSLIEALKAAQINTKNMSDESAMMQTIQDQLSSSQALQVAGAIANQQVEQLQKLLQLVAAQIQMQGTMANIAMDQANRSKAWEIKAKQKTLNYEVPKGSGWNSNFEF
ncbi:hypothetical protein [Thiofilum flexile]|uniref:hypothetical protein n=1 Tax=Thiofilum flexile TaxID=125627 RepID=UPI00037478B9|nr:hypothetical protein [Thiofilum flexile]